MEKEIDKVWRSVHGNLGMTIYWDIQQTKQKLINKDSIKRKMESMTDSLISRIIKNPNTDMCDENFITQYNKNPQLYREVIIEEYISGYESKFHPLYDFNQEIRSHKENVKITLERLKRRKNKTKEEYDSINVIKEYLNKKF
jgi:hypothetical protein